MKRTNQDISIEEVGKRLNDGFECMDDSKTAGLETMALVQDVKSSLKTREAKRLEVKYGSKSPRVSKALKKVKYYDTIKLGIAEQAKISTIKTSSFENDSWRIQGRVVDSDYKGVDQLTVSLFDEKGGWIRELGQACIDENGFFAITFKDDEQGQGQEKFKGQALILTVSDKEQKVIHQEEEPIFLEIGKIDTRLIILGEEKCVTPPVETTDTWGIRGTVTDGKTGKPLENMTVRLLDKEEEFGGKLGLVKTDQQGRYAMCYKREEFKELFERKPKFNVLVFDTTGKSVFRSEKTVRCIAGEEDVVNIEIQGKDNDVDSDEAMDLYIWTVKGVVKDRSGKPVKGVYVSLLDKDQGFSDELKPVETDENGQYQLLFTKVKHPLLFEKKPEFNVRVTNQNGKIVYTSRKTVQCTEGKVETFNIKISGRIVE